MRVWLINVFIMSELQSLNRETGRFQYVYIMSNPSFQDDMFKIGWTREHPSIRAKHLHTSGIPTPFVVEYVIRTKDGSKVERKIHEQLEPFRVNSNREFFQISKYDLMEILTNDLNYELMRISDIPPPPHANKKLHNKTVNTLKDIYDNLAAEAEEFFRESGYSSFVEYDIARYEKDIHALLHDYEGIKKRIGVERMREDHRYFKTTMLETHEYLRKLKIKYARGELDAF